MSAEKPPRYADRSSRRRLTNEEEHLWSTVVRGVEPLRHRRKAVRATNSGGAHAAKKKSAPPASVVHHRPAPASPPARPASIRPLTIAHREKQALARGRTTVDGRIDLHGMTQNEAHASLLRFLHRAQTDGAKFVLVITGKGAPLATQGGRGILRRQVPLWLSLPEFRACVLGFSVADASHGGDGALFVRLRRLRD
jgi:DNA-nicking Smr family endonuclease